MTPRRNWAGNQTYHARRLLRPRSLEELQATVASSESVRPIGSAHAFNDIADTTGDHISLAAMPRRLEIDAGRRTVTVDGGARLGDICGAVHAAGFALSVLPSLPHISAAGACATATHGSGDDSATLSSALRALEVVRPDGELRTVHRDDQPAGLRGDGVSLGALGVIAALTFGVEPAFDVRQDVFRELPYAAFVERFDAITGLADSVSFLTDWKRPAMHQVWLKRRVGVPRDELPPDLFGAVRATQDLHPIPGFSPAACTPQLGLVGPWHERLPHFRLTHTPSSGEELQSEYFVPRARAAEAFLALTRLRRFLAPLVWVTEIRTLVGDDLWLSPSHGGPAVAFHFTWKLDPAGVGSLLPDIEAALGEFDARPHWGKLFTMTPERVRSLYPRLSQFADLATRVDPEGKLANDFVRRYVLDLGR